MEVISASQFQVMYAQSVGLSLEEAQKSRDPFADALTEQIFYDGDAMDPADLVSRLVIERDAIAKTIDLIRSKTGATPIDKEASAVATIICALREFAERHRASDHCEHFDDAPPLDADEIDAFIKALNFGEISLLITKDASTST